MLPLRLPQLLADLLQQPVIFGQPEHVVQLVLLAPAHQLVSTEARIGPQHNLGLRPHPPQSPDHPRHLRQRPLGGVDVRWTQPRAQQLFVHKDVQRQITVVAVVAVKEPPLLVSVQRIVGGIQVQYDPLRLPLLPLDVEID